ncbi:hypothetical protein BYT27DRAFT_6966686 [Phlegmacium glaucopus]|nr:hypothetical protein BYT27DRAFT_6966686 [Phlegmacium glaucopus]
MAQAQSSEKKGSRWQADFKEAEECGGNEKVTSGEENVGRPGLVRRNSVETNLSESPNRRHVVLEDTTDEEDLWSLDATSEAIKHLASYCGGGRRTYRRGIIPYASTSKKESQVPGLTQSRLASPHRQHGYNLRMGSPMYFPNGSSFSPSMGSIYGYGVGGPRTVVHLGSKKYHQYIRSVV